jgi:biotin operon repressor
MAKTNNQILLEYLQAGNIVTTRNAPDELGIADVRANIRDLRDLGYEILDRWVSSTNRRGRKTTYKEYFLSNVN